MKYFFKYCFILLIAFFIINLFSKGSLAWFECLAVAIFITTLYKFIDDLGKNISIKNIIALICTMQWLLGPVLGYALNDYVFETYRMQVPKETFFTYLLPATLMQLIALYLPLGKVQQNLDFRNYPIDSYKKGRFLILLGFLGQMLPLGFVSFILGGLKFVGLFYMFSSANSYRKYWIALVFGSIFIISVGGGMFHDLLLWGSFFLMMYFMANKRNFLFRLSTILIGLFFILILQLVKSDYRSNLAKGNSSVTFNLGSFTSLIAQKFTNQESLFTTDNIVSTTSRINQGWIDARVMAHVPEVEPFARGKTIQNAIIASIFPRFLMPNKGLAGGRENMETYAGITLSETTSMDISQVSEAYANFGVQGGIAFMFAWGLFVNAILYFIQKKSLKYPDLIFWVPLIFLQVVKAETSFLTILNHLTKTALVTWFFFSRYGNQVLNLWFSTKPIRNVIASDSNDLPSKPPESI